MKNEINVLGTIYKCNEDDVLKNNLFTAYCSSDKPLIVIADMDDKERFEFNDEEEKDNYAKQVLRHEIIHAFFTECGLKDSSNRCEHWSVNEEMVDWIAIQFPKILKVFQELGCL